MFEKWLPVLSECELFSKISPLELNDVFKCLRPKVEDYEKNEIIAVAGETFTGLGIVLAGEVVVTKENSEGNRIIMAVFSPGEIFGEMAAFSPEGLWPATIVSRASSSVMFIQIGKITGFCEESCLSHSRLIANVLGIISRKAIMLNRKVEYLSIGSLRGKISAFLLEQHRKTGKTTFNIPMKRNELADFLNVTRPSLSREMGRLRDEGIIDFHRESIKIKDIEMLKNKSQF